VSRVVVVTGGAAGIGWAAARRFAAEGDRVLIADIDAGAAAERARSLGPGHAGIGADIGNPAAAETIVADCVARFGRLDVVVNNAGVIDSGGTPFTEQPLDALRRLLAINLLGMERVSHAARLVMRGQARGGVIVNLASGAAFRAIPLRNGYSASKAGVVAMTRAHGGAWAREGIRVNALAPGYIRTDLVAELIRRGRVDPRLAESRIPLGRMGTPEEMAACIAFLAGPAARGMAGSVLIADGGGAAFGGSDDAPVQRGAAPRPVPEGTPCYVVAGAGTKLGAACLHLLAATDADVVGVDGAGGIEDAARRSGRLDGLVNAAGMDGLLDPGADTATQVERHLEQHFLAAQAAGRIMLAQGFGAVVNLTGASGPGPDGGVIAAGAIGMLTRSMACEWGGSGVRANTLAASPHAEPDGVADAAAFLLSPGAGYVTGSTITLEG
jgi:NAD(P)-dependent dehydrogenase (short-subunit alcohol dehydrogenase family)